MKKKEEFHRRIEEYASKVDRIYSQAKDALIKLALGVTFTPGKVFKFKNYSRIASQVDAIIARLHGYTFGMVKGGIEAEWSNANEQLDNLVLDNLGKFDVKVFASYFNHNEGAMQAFLSRAKNEGGLGLSEKVWKYTQQLKAEIETALQVGIAEGKSAKVLAAQVRKYLQDPDGMLLKSNQLKLDLFKEIRGRGIYRSALKNAMRLTRTEINMAYHTADHIRRQQLDIIVGFEVHTSSVHKIDDVCDLLEGKYPKTFKFVGWHPQCMCYTTDLLCSKEELTKLTRSLVDGEDIKGFESVNQVKELPDNFHTWVEANKERAKSWESLPYFLRDNIDQIPALKDLSRT